MSYLAAATRHLYEEVPDVVPLLVLSKTLRVPEKEGMCHVSSCPRKAAEGEILCFDCLIRKDRRCLNFETCQSHNSGKSQLCRGCENKVKRQCENFSRCGNQKVFDHVHRVWYPTCRPCYAEQVELEKRCPYYDTCGGYRRIDRTTGERDDTCLECA